MAITPAKTPAPITRPAASTVNTVRQAEAPLAAPARATALAPSDSFGRPRVAPASVGSVISSLSHKLDHPFVMGGDGYLAIDDQGQVSGLPPSARVREFDGPSTGLDPLLQILGDGEKTDVHFQLPNGQSFSATSDEKGFERMPTSALPASAFSGVDPKRGGLAQVGVSAAGMDGSKSNVLVLPKNYDWPIFVCDIDDTLRATNPVDLVTGKVQPPIPGSKEILQKVAEQGIPIIYLSAGPDRIRPENEKFLAQMPPGILLDRGHLNAKGLLPINSIQAKDQGAYKAGVLNDLKSTFPGAKLFGMGDDKYGDAIAYTQTGTTAYIHDVRKGDANLPKDFHGTLTPDYTPEFIEKVSSDLKAAVAQSKSFGNG